MQGKRSQKCGPRPSVTRNRRNSSRVRSERAGARPLGPRGRGRAAAGRVDGARRARAQIPGVGKGLTLQPGPNVELVFKNILNIVYCSKKLLLFTLFRGAKTDRFGPKIGVTVKKLPTPPAAVLDRVYGRVTYRVELVGLHCYCDNPSECSVEGYSDTPVQVLGM